MACKAQDITARIGPWETQCQLDSLAFKYYFVSKIKAWVFDLFDIFFCQITGLHMDMLDDDEIKIACALFETFYKK